MKRAWTCCAKGSELLECFRHVTESRGTHIRAMCVAEEDQQPLAAKRNVCDLLSGRRIDELESASKRWGVTVMQPHDRGDCRHENNNSRYETPREDRPIPRLIS